jgi:hypothetical protein
MQHDKPRPEVFCDGMDEKVGKGHCGGIKYRPMTLDCLKANREELGITEAEAADILTELHAGHELADWETELLTYSDKWVYFELMCINSEQKERLWALVERLTAMFNSHTLPGPQGARLARLLGELKASARD